MRACANGHASAEAHKASLAGQAGLIPKLHKARPSVRQALRSAPEGCALEWPQLGLRLTLAGLLAQKL